MLNINWNTWLVDILPPTRRQQKTIDWLKVFYNEIETEYDWIMDYFDETMYEIKHNSQIMSLEHYINDNLQPSGGTIYISRDADKVIDIYNYLIQDYDVSVEDIYLFNNKEDILIDENTYVYKNSEIGSVDDVYLFTNDEHDADQIDFDLAMKTSDYNNLIFREKVIDKIEQYKLAGMSYQIVAY